MTTRTRLAAAVGVAAAASVVLLQGSLASADPGDHGGGHHGGDDPRLELDIRFSPFDLTDLGVPGPSAADLIVFNDVLLVDGVQVGHEVGSCVVVAVTDTGPLASCTAVITLDGQGTIAFALENSPAPSKPLAVTGGSGAFRSAGGDGVLVENGDGTGHLTLDLELGD
jgi:hypothetical protein